MSGGGNRRQLWVVHLWVVHLWAEAGELTHSSCEGLEAERMRLRISDGSPHPRTTVRNKFAVGIGKLLRIKVLWVMNPSANSTRRTRNNVQSKWFRPTVEAPAAGCI